MLSPRSKRLVTSRAALGAVPVVLSVLTYCASLRFQFVFDDQIMIVGNPRIRSWNYAAQYFTTAFASHMSQGMIAYYRPLVLLWLRVNDAIFGMTPAGFHATNVGLHAAVSVLAFVAARRLLSSARQGLLVAALFAVHPVHAECVAWVSGISEVLAGGFVLAAFVTWLRSRESGDRRWLVAAISLYAGALLSKETGIVLAAIVFAYAWIYSDDGLTLTKRVALATAAASPFLLVAGLYWIIREYAIRGAAGVGAPSMSWGTMILTWPSLLWFYVRGLLWRWESSAYYDFSPVARVGLKEFILPAAWVVLICVGFAGWAYRDQKNRRIVLFGSVWTAMSLAPVMYLRVFLNQDYVHLRYLYLPSFGFLLLCAAGLSAMIERFGLQRWSVGMAAVGFSLLMVAALFQESYWANDLTLYRRSAQVAPKNPNARNNYANVLYDKGRYAESVEEYAEVLRLEPGAWFPNYNMGRGLLRLRRHGEAKEYFDRAIAISPNDADEFCLRGLTNLALGNRPEGIEDLRTAVSLAPDEREYKDVLKQVESTGAK
jgi:tetratricopeptide (TPR) repeat protein